MENDLKNKHLYSANKPLTDVNGKLLEEGQKVKILVSKHNFAAGIESEVRKVHNEDEDIMVWGAVRPGIITYLNLENSKNYEIIE